MVREEINRRILPIEIERFDWDNLDNIDYADLFMGAYWLFKDGFRYSYQFEDKELLTNLYQDYILKSDLNHILDKYVQKPETPQDTVFISTLDIVSSLINFYPRFGKKINAVAVGKILNERGFVSIRQGKERITGYEIHKESLIMKLPGNYDTILFG